MKAPKCPRDGYILNPDEHIRNIILKGLKQKDGHCPCKLDQTKDTKCPCTEFREGGECHCQLFINEEMIEDV